jgi:glyoxylase-like metal-dependent hydrolase (beta-lactamase superfamily II)
VTWQRVNLGFVSAYVLARDGEAVVVDTGVSGSGTDIEASLRVLGLAWSAVGHVILTHRHSDHVGSAGEVLALAPDATAYAGTAEIAAISVPRPLVAVEDGDDVFGLRIVATPGHTPGHISVLDPVGGILVAGDALNTSGGAVSGSTPQFTDDASAAEASVRKLAAVAFETLLVGHGEPILTGADRLVRELAAGQ